MHKNVSIMSKTCWIMQKFKHIKLLILIHVVGPGFPMYLYIYGKLSDQ